MAKISPTARSMRLLDGAGWLCRRVEQWNAFAKVRQDLWGADLICIHPGTLEVMLVQVTTKPNMNARLRKITGILEARLWVMADLRYEIHGWYKDRKMGWCCANHLLTDADLNSDSEESNG